MSNFLRILKKLIQISLFFLLLGLIGLLFGKCPNESPYNNLLNNKCDMRNLWSDLGSFREDLQYFVFAPKLLIVFAFATLVIAIYRTVCLALSFFWLIIYTIKFLIWKNSWDIGCLSIPERKFQEAPSMGLIRFFLIHIPECAGYIGSYALFYGWFEGYKSFSIRKTIEIIFLNTVAGTSVWNIAVACIITRRLEDKITFSYGIEYCWNKVTWELKLIFLHEINATITIAKELRFFKENGKVRFNPPHLIKDLIQPKNKNNVLIKIFSKSEKGMSVMHPGLLTYEPKLLDSNFITGLQMTGKPVDFAEYITLNAIDYKYSEMHLQYNIIQNIQNVKPNPSSSVLTSCGLSSVKNQQIIVDLVKAKRLLDNNYIIYETPDGGKIIHEHSFKCMAKGILDLNERSKNHIFDKVFLLKQDRIVNWIDSKSEQELSAIKEILPTEPIIINFHKGTKWSNYDELHNILNSKYNGLPY